METTKNPKKKGAFSLGNKQENMNTNDPNNQYNNLNNGQAVIKEGATVAQPPVEQVQPTQPPVAQVQPTQPVAQVQPTQPVAQEQPTQPVAQEQFSNDNHSTAFTPGSTYFKSGNERDGFIEIDLNFSRFRGEENRYLSIGLSGFDVGADNNTIPTQSSISITNEQDFNNFKEFVRNLNWND